MLIAYFYTPEGYSFATADLRYWPVTLRVSSYAKKYTTKVELIEKIVEYMRKTNFKDLATDSEISESIKTIPEFEESSKVNFDSIPA